MNEGGEREADGVNTSDVEDGDENEGDGFGIRFKGYLQWTHPCHCSHAPHCMGDALLQIGLIVKV